MQKLLNDQDLPILGGAVLALSPTHIGMSMLTSLNTPLPAKLHATELLLYNQNSSAEYAFSKLQLPEMRIDGKTDVSVVNQTLLITNDTELTAWLEDFFVKETVTMSMKGKPHVSLGALEYSADLDKTMEFAGLNYMKGFGIIDQELMLNSNESESNMKGHLNIPNPGPFTLGFGDLTFNVLAGNIRLGIITVYNVVVQPGNNTLDFEGSLFFDQIIPNLSAILDSQKQALAEGSLEVFASGNKTVVDGTRIPYVENVFATKRVPMKLSVISLLSSLMSSLLNADQNSLLDIVGEAVGNRTLFENVLDHWDNARQKDSEAKKRSLVKTMKGGRSWMLSLMKLGLKRRKA